MPVWRSNAPSKGVSPVAILAPQISDNPITAPTDIIGTVTDEGEVNYILEIAPQKGGEFVEIARGNTSVNDAKLGKFDTSLLENGSYILRLTATDSGGNSAIDEVIVDVTGELKLGNFQLSFTDLEIPVAGIPISLTRTYDSLGANRSDNFGYGWRLEFRDTDLTTSARERTAQEELLGIYSAFSSQERVYITLPGGERTGFTFKPKGSILNQYLLGFLGSGAAAGLMYHPEFVADDGSDLTLRVKNAQNTYLIRKAGSDEYVEVVSAVPYNPAATRFGGVYILETGDGVEYEIDADSGDLITVTDTNDNQLSFSEGGIVSSTGVSVTFERDVHRRIVAAINPEGNKIKYEYDAQGDLVGVIDRSGNRTGFEYDEERKHYLAEIIDPLGRSGVRSEYDQEGRLKRIIDVNGEAVELVYDPDNSIQTVRDVFGHETIYEYDERGNVVTEIDAVGLVTQRSYDDDNNLKTETLITDESGVEGWTTRYSYDADGNKLSETDALGNTTRWTYGKYNRLLSETDALGNTTTYSYDSRGNLLSSKDAAGNITKYSYDSSGNLRFLTDTQDKITSFSYNSRGNVTKVTDAAGNQTTYTYDYQGNRESETRTVTTNNGIEEIVTRSRYDKEGNLREVTDAEEFTTHYEYDANNQQTAVIDALLRKTEYRYDAQGQLIETIYPDNTPETLDDNPRIITLYDKGGRQRAEIDQTRRVTYYNYDPVGRLIETIYSDESETLEQLLAQIAPGETLTTVDWTEIVYPDASPAYLNDNHRIRTEYTQDGRIQANIDERGNRTEYRYDALGRRTTTFYPDDTPLDLSDNPTTTVEYDATGRKLSETNEEGHTTNYEYDDVGRLTKTIFHDDTSTHISYDSLGRRESVTDQNGKVVEFEYNDLGRLTAVVQFLNQESENRRELKTEYRYDELGRLLEVEDANDQITKYSYDKLGRRIAVELPLGQSSLSTYDAVGNLKTYTDFNGEVTGYNYDAMNRIIFKDYEDDADVSYTYTANGQIESITDGRGVTEFGYDELGRLLWRNDPEGETTDNGHTIEYEYDAAGNRTTVITPNGRVDYTYDERNRLETVTASEGGTTIYAYDDANNLIRTEFPNGVVETRKYDDLNRLVWLENTLSDEVLSSYDYQLNDAGHRLSVTEANNRRVEYEYDDLYRLTQEKINDGQRVISYSYDDVGNRTLRDDSQLGVTSYVYDDNDRLSTETLVKDGETVHSITYNYDDNGNLISRTKVVDGVSETTTYTWNDDNRLVRVKLPNGDVVEYEYDDEGIRVSSTVNGETTEYLIDKNRPYAQVLEEFSTVELQAFYVYGHDLISQSRNGEKDLYQVDGLGSTRVLTDEMGVVTDTYDYDVFGEEIESTGESENSYLFAGEQFDEELEEYYLRQRFYDPGLGRFTRRDSYEGRLGEPITLHKYLYGNGNPVSYIDPSGLFSIKEVLGTLSAVSALINATKAVHHSYKAAVAETPEEFNREIFWAGANTLGVFLGLAGGGFTGPSGSVGLAGGGTVPAVVSEGYLIGSVAIPTTQTILAISTTGGGGYGFSIDVKDDHVNKPKHCLDDLAPTWSEQRDLLVNTVSSVASSLTGTPGSVGSPGTLITEIPSSTFPGRNVTTTIRYFRYNTGRIIINTAFVPISECSHPIP
ncbi:RHS repeat-associated core domain-containing protein [Oscillatoria salina]|uniref:RHS repeat-associated core domain-containing protein n=1 Tax=Oscillatoria salina TaxID=331517 RepID=UPI001CCFE6CA|nr:RHS repeat-associated core domain-containing protein [Oscillatoria salina]MBZ8178549.1 RHS repeat protein [Oscillatoria salina IIICB1]